MTELWCRFWSPVVSVGEETTQRQIFRLMVWGLCVLPCNRRNAFLITLVSDQTNRVHPITAKLNIFEQFVAGLCRKNLV